MKGSLASSILQGIYNGRRDDCQESLSCLVNVVFDEENTTTNLKKCSPVCQNQRKGFTEYNISHILVTPINGMNKGETKSCHLGKYKRLKHYIHIEQHVY